MHRAQPGEVSPRRRGFLEGDDRRFSASSRRSCLACSSEWKSARQRPGI